MFVVGVSDPALDAMLLAAAESYYLGSGERRKGRKGPRYVEVNGYVWGTRSLSDDACYVHVDRFSLSLSSRKHADWFVTDPKAPWLMHSIMHRRSPQLELLGELHTHPYDSLEEVKVNKGWEFSEADRQWWPESKDDASSIWHLYGDVFPPLWMVLAVAPLQKVNGKFDAEPLNDRHNVWQFDVGELRFWLHAEIGERDAGGYVQFEPDVILDMYPRFLTLPGERLRQDLGG